MLRAPQSFLNKSTDLFPPPLFSLFFIIKLDKINETQRKNNLKFCPLKNEAKKSPVYLNGWQF